MRMQLSHQAAERLGQSELVIITERVDDVAFLIGQMAFPVHRKNFVRQSDIAFENKWLQALAKIARLVRIRGRDVQRHKRWGKASHLAVSINNVSSTR